MTASMDSSPTDIPAEVTQKFLAALEERKLPKAVIARLRAALLSEKKPSRKVLSEALFTEEPLP